MDTEVEQLKARIAELEAGEVTHEWAAKWPAATPLNAQFERAERARDGGELVDTEVEQLKARIAELEAGEVTHEWAAKWPAATPLNAQFERAERARDGGESYARRVALQYPDAQLVRREVRRGPWTATS